MRMTAPTIMQALVVVGVTLQPLPLAAQGTRGPTSATPRPRTIAPAAPAPAQASAPRPTAAVTPSRTWTEQEYRLGAGDKLRVEVYRQEQLSQSVQIRPDGKITLPFIGDVVAAGQTSIELRDALSAAFKEYVNNPVVTVIVQEALSAQIHVIGEVEKSGTQVMQGPTSVLQAIAQAGGLREFAKQGQISVLRRTASGTTRIPVNYKDALKGRADPVYLQPGDTVVVP